MNPKISIITITFNSEKTVRDTLESVKKQNYPNLEYIIIDGGSTDGTLKIVHEYDSIITHLVSEPDNGISDAMNKGIKLSTGDLIGIIHSDDMLTENSLSVLASNWDKEYDVFYGDAIILKQTGEKSHILKADTNLNKLCYNFCLIHPATFVSKEAYNKYGVYSLNFKCCMDYELFLRMYKKGAKFKNIPKLLACFRLGGYNQINRSKTINEVKDISILYGANKLIAYILKYKKISFDFVRPIINFFGIKNKRVE